MAKNNAYMPDINTVISMGINPKTGLPYKMGGDPVHLKEDIKRVLRVLDEQNALNRYTWYNLPSGLDGQLLERILYYKGQAAFFYMKENDTFYFLPYSLSAPEDSSGIDIYGRFTGITPLTFNGTFDDKKDKPFIQGMIKLPKYEVILPEDLEIDDLDKGCVLLSDYSKQLSQTNISRQILNDPILDAMSEAFPMARTALLANSGIKGMRVNDADQQAQVKAASRSITNAALTGDPWIPYVGNVEFQDMTNSGAPYSPEDYLMYLQSLDNFRLGLYGLDNPGVFQKKDHMLQDEQDMNAGNNSLVYADGLVIRQRFCDIVNSIWGLGIWCDSSEIVSMVDNDGDGRIQNSQDNTGYTSSNNGGAENVE